MHQSSLTKPVAGLFLAIVFVLSGAAGAQTESEAAEGSVANVPRGAEELALELTDGLPCSATETADALERRLTDSLAQLSDLYAALEVVSSSDELCADIRAAAARQRLYIARASGEEFNRDANDTPVDTSRALSFQVGPPPLNLVKRSAGGS